MEEEEEEIKGKVIRAEQQKPRRMYRQSHVFQIPM
jgi:hypothetical protein